MFDEYVEHVSNPTARSPQPRSLPQLRYEGFESSTQADDVMNGGYTTLETGYVTGLGQPEYEPIFELAGVQHTLPSALVSLTVSSNILTMAFKSSTLQQLSLKNADNIANISLQKKGDVSISKIFSDPSGKHVLIATPQGENFYLYEGWTKARPLAKCKLVIESVSWNPNPTTTSSAYPRTSTKEILLGGRNGTIYEMLLDAHDDIFKPHDRYVSPLYTLPDRQPVTGIHAEYLSGGKRLVVLATSASRIYQFVGPVDRRPDDVGKLYDSVFAPYRDAAPKFLELPGASSHSELHVFSRPSLKNPKAMAWLTAQGIYHGTLNLSTTGTEIIDSASLLQYPYPSASSPTSSVQPGPNLIPISILVTDFHFILLYSDRVCAVSSLNEKVVYEELLALKPNERPLGLAADHTNKTYWVYTNASILEIPVRNEDRDVWKIYLGRAQHDLALQYAKLPAQRAQVNASLADEHFQAGRFIQAAQCYAQSSRGFEDVALAFTDAGEPDALRYFLVTRLERLPKNAVTQRMMLSTWLVEFYLGKLNTLDDIVASESASQDVDNLHAERTMVEDELRQFFDTYKTNLHKQTVYELILSHGRTDVFLYYATVVGDFERVVEHHVTNEEYLKAIDVLNRQSDLALHYRFSSVLMRHAPKETVDSWLRQRALDPHRLIPALLQTQHLPPSPLTPNHAVRYLNYVIFSTGFTSPMIHNLLLTFLASPNTNNAISSPTSSHNRLPNGAGAIPDHTDPSDLPLLRFLSNAPVDVITSRPYYDLDYALRICKRNNRLKACVHIYAQMGMWEESVELALEMGELELAKVNADRPEDDEVLRKKLWLMVAKYVVQDKKDIKTAMRFLESTSVLKIEDILPFFPDFVVIDDFKDEICNALEGYSAHIDSLKSEMNDATKTAEMIKQDLADLKNRFVTVEQNDKCATCEQQLLTRQFYVFPCHHTFHADCLIGQVKEYLPSTVLRRIIHLQDELVRITTGSVERKGHSRQATNASIPEPPEAHNPPRQQTPAPQPSRGLLSTNFGNGLARSVVAPAVVGRNVFAAAGAGLRDLIIPESLASAITGNINLNLNPWGSGGNDGREGKSASQLREKAEKLREELDELLASGCPLCESIVAGLDRPFVLPGEGDKSWEL